MAPVAAAGYWKRHALASARLSWRLTVIPLLFLPGVWQRAGVDWRGNVAEGMVFAEEDCYF